MATVNISIPKEMHEDMKRLLKKGRYSSISELVRDGLRRILDKEEEITENGFTREFEEAVLRSEAEPRNKDLVWETDEDVDKYFNELDKKIKKKHAKD